MASSFGVNDVSVAEGAPGATINATFTVQLSPAAAGVTTVDFDVVSDSATGGADFAPKNVVVTFPPGSTSQLVSVAVKGDAVPEVNETFHASLSHPTGGTDIARATGIGTILDDDSTNNDAFANARVIAGDFAVQAGNNLSATLESGEPAAPFSAGRTIWWKWTAASDGTVTANTFGSAIDSLLTVCTGTSVNDLTVVTFNDDFGPIGHSIPQSEVRFPAKAGTTYLFAVDSFAGSAPNGGTVIFTLAATAAGTGKFHGLIGPTSFDGTSVGSLDVTRTAAGRLMATGTFNARPFTFAGSLDANGRYSGDVVIRNLGTVAIALAFDTTRTSGIATGTLTFAGAVAQIRLDQAAFSRANPAPQAGAYTFAIPFDGAAAPLAPRAHGSGTVSVSKTGAVHVSGRLGDGTPFASQAFMSASGEARFFKLLYARKGSASLALQFAPTANADFTGTVRWSHPLTAALREPQAYTAVLGALGSPYAIPAAGVRVLPGFDATAGAGTATLTDGNLVSTITRALNLGTNNKITVTGSTEALAINITRANGLVTGSFKHPVTNRFVSFKGASLRQNSQIYGLFPGKDKNGALLVKPGP